MVSSPARLQQRACLGLSTAGVVGIVIVGRGVPHFAFIALVGTTFVAFSALVLSLTRHPPTSAPRHRDIDHLLILAVAAS